MNWNDYASDTRPRSLLQHPSFDERSVCSVFFENEAKELRLPRPISTSLAVKLQRSVKIRNRFNEDLILKSNFGGWQALCETALRNRIVDCENRG